jgi:RHS repeat-associated protein
VYTRSFLHYGHPDRVGSLRFSSTHSRTMSKDLAYAPLGELYATARTMDQSFTGQHRDTTTNLYDFPLREYSVQGRWPSPDPVELQLRPPEPDWVGDEPGGFRRGLLGPGVHD